MRKLPIRHSVPNYENVAEPKHRIRINNSHHNPRQILWRSCRAGAYFSMRRLYVHACVSVRVCLRVSRFPRGHYRGAATMKEKKRSFPSKRPGYDSCAHAAIDFAGVLRIRSASRALFFLASRAA
jgi:hypothetical protein